MANIFLNLYLIAILIRPMEWWLPLAGVELVTMGAILIILTGFPVLLARVSIIWKTIPQVKISLIFLLAVSLSPLTRFWMGGMLNVLNDLGKVIVFYILIILLTRSMKNFTALMFAFLFCTTWLSIHAIMQHYLGYGFGGELPLSRKVNAKTGEIVYQAVAYGTFDDPNDLCVVLVVALPLLFAQLKSKNAVIKILSLLGLLVTIFGVFCTNSRGGIVALLGMTITAIVARTKGISRYLIIGCAALMITVLAPSRFSGDRKSTRLNSSH